MKEFKICWKALIYGESVIEATDEEEARIKAKNDEDFDFEMLDEDMNVCDWEIYDIVEIE